MTLFLDYRTDDQAGDIRPDPAIYDARMVAGAVRREANLPRVPADRLAARHVVFATHGFNVNRRDGTACLEALERELNLGPGVLFIGVLWPGSWYVKAINYPTEGKDASACGDKLAAFATRGLAGAAAVSFLSHSLGGRLILQAVKGLKDQTREIRQVCMVAPAVDDRCLAPGKAYETARRKAGRTTVLASEKDEALGAVYSAGSFAAAILGDDHPYGSALGLKGARPVPLAGLEVCQIPKALVYRHGDYFPPSDPGQTNPKASKSIRVMAAALGGGSVVWPF